MLGPEVPIPSDAPSSRGAHIERSLLPCLALWAFCLVPRRLDVQVHDLAVGDEHRIALGAHTEATLTQILLQAKGPCELAEPIREHADLPGHTVLTPPRCQDLGIGSPFWILNCGGWNGAGMVCEHAGHHDLLWSEDLCLREHLRDLLHA